MKDDSKAVMNCLCQIIRNINQRLAYFSYSIFITDANLKTKQNQTTIAFQQKNRYKEESS